MRTIGLLAILMLACGLAFGPAPAIAKDDAAIQQFQTAFKPMTDAELGQVRGKALAQQQFSLRQVVLCVYKQLPAETQQNVRLIYQHFRYFTGNAQPTQR